MTRNLRAATVVVLVIAVVLLVVRIVARERSLMAPVEVDLEFTNAVDEPIEGREDLVFDPVLGHRLPREASWTVPDGARRTNDHGFVDTEDYGSAIQGPRILWLADDLLGGVPNAASAPALVEQGLHAEGSWPSAVVLDATTPGDGMWHQALRARVLAPRYAPAVLVACVHLPDDMTALASEALPEREQLLDESGSDVETDELRRMAVACVERLLELAPRHGGTLLVVLLPDRELLAADVAAPARTVVVELRQILDRKHVSNVDLTDAFPPEDAEKLYFSDGRLTPAGHERVSAAVLPRLQRILSSL